MEKISFEHLLLSEERVLRPDEYRRKEDQMICCKNCHTPRERFLEILGKTFRPRMLCVCQAQQYEQEQEADRQHRFREQIERNRSIGLPDPEIKKHTFANSLGYNPGQLESARHYVEHWEEMKKDGIGLLFWGDVGSGKSFLAGCIANALLDKGIRVMMTNFSRLLNRLSDYQSSDRNSFIDSLNSYPLLIIDDLGIERNSDYAKEQVFSVIDSRYRTGLPMIVTTNLTMKELTDPGDTAKKRIYNRVLERCLPIRVSQQNIRNINLGKTLQKANGVIFRM